MIIDMHTHLFPDELAPKAFATLKAKSNNLYESVTDMTLKSLLNIMDKWNIDISVVQPVVTKQSQTIKINEWAKSICSERIISFGGIYPHTDNYKRDIDFVCSLGLKGLKFHAEYQDFVLDDKHMLEIYDYALSKGLILLHHGGYDPAFKPPFRTTPKQFANVADAMNGGVIIAAHLGGQSQWDDVEKYLVGKKIFLDTSMGFKYYSQEQFLRIVKAHGSNKILFGSDSPWSNTKSEIEHIKALPLTDNEKSNILCLTAKKILGL